MKKEKWANAYNQTVELKCISIQNNENYCKSNPCKSNGTCYNGLSDYYCDCNCGWKGKDCKIGKPKCHFRKKGRKLIDTPFQKIKYNLTANWNAIPMNCQKKMKSFDPST